MPVDTSIYSMIQQPDYVRPMDRYGKAMQLRALAGQNQLQQMQMQEVQRGMDSRMRLRELYSKHPDGNVPLNEVMAIDPEMGMKVQASQLGIEKTRGDIAKNTTEIAAKQNEIVRNAIASMQGDEDVPQVKEIMSSLSTVGPDKANALFPEGFQFTPEWQNKVIMTADKLIESAKPDYKTVDAGGQVLTRQMNPQAAGFDAAPIQKTASVSDLMGDARSREAAEKAKWTVDTKRGLLVNKDTGETKPITTEGKPVGVVPKPLTEGQGRGQMFGTRAAKADLILKDLENDVSVLGLSAAKILGSAGNYTLTPAQQKFAQAKRDFVNAVLRQESGAVINPDEFVNADKQYFRQPGDSDEVVEQKRQNRKTAIEGFEVMAGPAGERVKKAGQPEGMNDMPDPAQHKGKRIKDTQTGVSYVSDGTQWQRQ